MIDELWINGQKADMKAESGIYLDYRSNIFGDLSKITSNFSYTISLPLTTKNISLLDSCIHVGSTSEYPKAVQNAVVKRDGVPIVQNASLHLIKVSPNSIDVALSWGVGEELSKFINSKDKLSDLTSLVSDNGKTYTSFPYNSELEADKRWLPKYSQGLYGMDAKRYNLPVAPVQDIIRAINAKYGISIGFEGATYNSWVLPITKAKGGSGEVFFENDAVINKYAEVEALPLLVRSGSQTTTSNPTLMQWKDRNTYSIPSKSMSSQFGQGDAKVTASINCEVTINWFGQVGADNYALEQDMRLVVSYIKQSGGSQYAIDKDNIIQEITPTSIVYDPTEIATRFSFVEAIEYEHKRYTDVGLFLYANGKIICVGYEAIGKYTKVKTTFNASYETTSLDLDQAATNGSIPVAGNLPDIEVKEFLKAIFLMCGQFPVVATIARNAISATPYSRLSLNKSIAKDWTKHLVTSKDWIPKMSFKAGIEGKENLFKYKDGEGEGWDASFFINKAQLEDEKTIASLPFTTYRTIGNTPYIPLWEYEDNDGVYTPKFKGSDKVYIGNVILNSMTDYGVKWSDLLYSHYGQFISWLTDAKVVEEEFVLTGVELADIDYSIPIYLNQYGAFFAIIEIKTKANNMADVKLIKIS